MDGVHRQCERQQQCGARRSTKAWQRPNDHANNRCEQNQEQQIRVGHHRRHGGNRFGHCRLSVIEFRENTAREADLKHEIK